MVELRARWRVYSRTVPMHVREVLRPSRWKLPLAVALAATVAAAPQAWATALDAAPRPSPGTRVMAVVQRIASSLRETQYRHDLRVDERHGLYEWDCSLMVAWVLARSAPRSLAAVGSHRPVAVDFVRAILHAPTLRPRSGWQRIARVADAQPGDVLAWQRPPWFPSHNSGHVAFVLAPPQPVQGGVLIRIADASSYNHDADTRAGGTGFGMGTILITTDPSTGEGTGYGWFGIYSGEWIVQTPVVIGRVAD
jgi:hypothetical protein